MTKTFLTFKKFSDEKRAKELKRFLSDNNINCFITDNISSLGDNFSNSLYHEFKVKIKIADNEKALRVYEEKVELMLTEVENDHYLFSHTIKELYAVLLKGAEGQEFEYRLAYKILTEKGKPVDSEFMDALKKKKENPKWKNISPMRKQSALWILWPF